MTPITRIVCIHNQISFVPSYVLCMHQYKENAPFNNYLFEILVDMRRMDMRSMFDLETGWSKLNFDWYQYQLDTTTNFEFGHLDLLEHHHRHPIISIIHSHSTGSASAASTWKHVRYVHHYILPVKIPYLAQVLQRSIVVSVGRYGMVRVLKVKY